MEEEWKPIKDYDNYEISNLGMVRNKKTLQILKNTVNGHGYYICSLVNKNGRKSKDIHRLLGIYFIPNIDNKPCINHINGIKTDIRLENLEWVTYSENSKHAWDIGLSVVTQRHLKSLQKAMESRKKKYVVM